ncbi:aldehyde dehydrogenase family protein [Streptomyces canus]|uniref:aldehyde dehydrogenase family protein n=1 Tax=Streptomyces canus TaxID=58343 RepID=UPI0003762EED|nr:aldehyde dehydrogenase family protein [Streptomyces canus]
MSVDTSSTRKHLDRYPAPYLAIAGQRRTGGGRETFSVVNPTTGATLGALPLATATDLEDALAATREAFETWSALSVYARREVLHSAARWLRENKDEGATRIALELGKPFGEALTEVNLSASLLEWAADEALRAYGRIIPGRRPGLHLEARLRPVGPVYAVSSWNAPLNTPSRKVSGALAAGCSLVLKLSEQAPSTGLFLLEALDAAGAPAGLVQMVSGHGPDISDVLIPSDEIRMITVTGSVGLGRTLAAQAAGHLKPQILELGGHAPVVVHRDTDVAKVARGAARAKFRNVGQTCISPTRFLVHQDIHDRFVAEFVAETSRMTVGDPFADGTAIGPMQNEKQCAHIEGLIADAVERGAHLAAGGERLQDGSLFLAPTVLTGVPADARVRSVEPFGPLATVESYTALEEAVAVANSVSVGLAAYAFTASGPTAEYLATHLRAGNIVLNNWNASFPETPFGGVHDSGYGREGGVEGVRDFMTTVFVSNEY